jgi:glutaredoxin
MKHAQTLLITALLVAAMPASAQTMYQWKDPKTGNMIYSDQPPPPGLRPQSQKPGAEPTDNRQQSYAAKVAAEKYPVTLYTSAECLEHCANARALLNGRGVPFNEKLVQSDSPESMAELKTITGGEPMVPTMTVGTQRFKGFDTSAWNNLLDLAGYPKSAPYGSKPSGAFAQ